MSAIGIGITTTHDRKKLFDYGFEKQEEMFNQTHLQEFYFTANIDDNKSGIAYSKNKNLRVLMDNGCTHIFLFDDDCYPVSADWYLKFIEAATQQDQHHLMYINPKPYTLPQTGKIDIGLPFGEHLVKYDHSNGCMLYFDRECIETCGGFNEKFDTYGYEHDELSQRICNMGLTSFPYLTIKDVEKYIWACDFDGLPEGIEDDGKKATDGLDLKKILAKNEKLYNKMLTSNKKIPL